MEGISIPEGTEKPRWQVVEQVNVARNEAVRPSEDAILVDDSCYAVLDGVSSGDSTERIDGLTPGQFAVQVGMRALKEAAEFENKEDIVPHVTKRLRESLHGRELTSSPSFVFVAFFPKHNCLIRVGDCSYLDNGVGNNLGLAFDRLKAKDRAQAITQMLAQGALPEKLLAADPTRPRMRMLSNTIQKRLANAPDSGRSTIFDRYRYGVINGTDVPADLVEYIPVDGPLVLATDGYSPAALRMTLEETEKENQRMIAEDPLAIGPMLSTRGIQPETIDDRAYLRVERS